MKEMPTIKTNCSQNTLQFMNWIELHSKEMNQLFTLRLSKKIKHCRWKCYIHKQMTLDETCKKIIGNDKKNRIIAYGDASFCHNSKGHPPSLRGNWIYHRLKYIHKANVMYVREFNTSKVCSNCHYSKEMIGFDNGSHHVNKHFVRSCTNCHMIWNRDVNASLNMIYLAKEMIAGRQRPELFSKSLKHALQT